MIEHLVIKLAPRGTDVEAAFIASADGKWLRSADIKSLDGSSYAGVWAVANGVDVSLFRQELPALPEGKIRKIIPSVMADQLGQGASEQHFAFWGGAETEKLVAVASDEYMRTVQTTLAGVGVTVTALVPDYCLLKAGENIQAVLCSDGYCRVKMLDRTGFTVEAGIAPTMLGDLKARELSIEEEQEMHASVVHSQENLLQGSYAASAGFSAMFLLFKRAMFLFIAVCAVWGGTLYSEISNMEATADQLYAEAENLFRQAFPEVRRVVNVEVQARQQINRLQTGSTSEFLQLSSALFKAVEQSETTLLEAIRFDADRGELVATLSFPSFAEGEKLKTALTQENIRLNEGSSRQENNRIYTDITLRSGL